MDSRPAAGCRTWQARILPCTQYLLQVRLRRVVLGLRQPEDRALAQLARQRLIFRGRDQRPCAALVRQARECVDGLIADVLVGFLPERSEDRLLHLRRLRVREPEPGLRANLADLVRVAEADQVRGRTRRLRLPERESSVLAH